jgi:hypothetical protein
MRRRVIIWSVVLVTLLGLLLAADRIGVYVAEKQIAKRIADSPQLDGVDNPKVTLSGFPFLTQVFGGDYKHAHAVAHSLRRGDVEVKTLTVDLRGIHVPFSDLTSGSVKSAPVDDVTGTALVTYQELEKQPDLQGITLQYVQGQSWLRASGSVEVLGNPVKLTARADVSIQPDGTLKVVAHDVQAPLGVPLPASVTRQISDKLSRTIVVPPLPFGLKLQSVKPTPDGLVGYVHARNITLTN